MRQHRGKGGPLNRLRVAVLGCVYKRGARQMCVKTWACERYREWDFPGQGVVTSSCRTARHYLALPPCLHCGARMTVWLMTATQDRSCGGQTVITCTQGTGDLTRSRQLEEKQNQIPLCFLIKSRGWWHSCDQLVWHCSVHLASLGYQAQVLMLSQFVDDWRRMGVFCVSLSLWIVMLSASCVQATRLGPYKPQCLVMSPQTLPYPEPMLWLDQPYSYYDREIHLTTTIREL